MAIRSTGVKYDIIARDSASRVFRTVGNAAGRLDSGFGRLAKTAAYAGAVMAGGLAVGMVESAKKAVEFEASMKKVQTQAGASAKDVSVLSKGVLELGKTAQQGPQALSEAMYHLKSVGMDNADALKSLKVASDLAAVGGSNLEETTNALAGAWRTGIKGAQSFSQAAGTVNAIIGAGNMTMQQFTEAIGTGILPSAKSFGLSLNQVGGALALMTDEGVPAVDAATRLRMSFSLLGAPSAAADKQLKKIGLTGLDLAKAMRGSNGIIGAVSLLKTHLDKSGMSAAQTSQLLSRAFGGGKSDSAILTMLNNLDVLRKKQDQVNASTGKFGAAVTAQRKTASAQFGILKSNLDVFAIETGTKLLPPITGFVSYLNKTGLPAAGRFSRALMRLVPVDQIRAGFSTVEGLVSDFMKGFDKAPAKKALTLPTPTVKVPSTLIPDGLRKPLEVPSPTLKMARTPIPVGVKALAPVKSQAQQLGEQLRGLVSGGIGDAVGKIDWGRLGKQLGDGLGKAFDWVAAHGTDLSKRLAKVIGSVDWANVGKSLGVIAVPLAIGIIDNLFAPLFTTSFWSKHWLDVIVAAISVLPIDQVFSVVGKGLGKIPWGKLGDVMDHIPWGRIFRWSEWITRPIGGAVRATGTFVARLVTGFTDAFSRKFPRIAQFFYEQLLLLPVRLGDLGRLLKNKAGTLLSGLGEKLTSSIPGWGSKFIRGVYKFFGRFTFWQTGLQLVEGLLSGVDHAFIGIGKWIKSHVIDPVVNWTKSLFGIHSPSTIFAGIGGDLIHGLTGGVSAAISGIGKWLQSHVVSPILGAFFSAGSWLYGPGLGVVAGLLSGIGSAAAKIGGWVTSNIVSPILGAFFGAGAWLYNIGSNMMDGLLSGITSGFHDITRYLSGVKDTIGSTLSGITGSVGGIVGKLHIPGLATGGLAPIGQTAWVGEKGPELMQVTPKGTRIFSNAQSMAIAGVTNLHVPGYASGTVPAALTRVAQAQDDVARARQRRVGLKAAETRLKAAEQELANARRATKLTVSNTLANGFLKTLETSTAAGIASAIKSMNSKLQAAGLGGLVPGNLATSSRMQALANQRAAVQSRIATAQQYASDQSTSLGDFLSLSNTPSASISSLISRMAARQKQASGFASEVSGLSKRGLDKNLLSQLADAGPGSQLAALLAKATAADIGQLNKLAVSQQKLTVSFGRSMADAMYDSGSQAGRGFLSGLQAQEKAIQAEMNRLAAGMVNTIKKKLGIRSPSTVMRDQIGRQVVLGAAAGVRQYAPHATREVQRMADTMAAVRARSGAVPVAVGGGGQVVHNESHTHYEINARTADFTPQQLEVLQRKAEARQRVGRPR